MPSTSTPQHVIDVNRFIWRSGQHIGDYRPRCVVAVRSITFDRDYRDFGFLSGRKREKMGSIVGGHNDKPWQATMRPAHPDPGWVILPNITTVDISGEVNRGNAKGGLSSGTTGSGFFTATVKLENLLLKALTGALGTYHAISRGGLSPYLGYLGAWSQPVKKAEIANEWFGRLAGGYQIKIWQGYGAEAVVPVFTGVIDTADMDSAPDTITLTARDFGGRMLSDQQVYGVNKARECQSPITFASPGYVKQTKAQAASKKSHWIMVNDAADVVRWVLMWAGFKEWYVEDFGTQLKQPITFHQGDYLIDIINYITAQANWVFYMDCPTEHDLSMGVPVFRECHALLPPSPLDQTISENDTLLGVTIRHSTEPLPYVIRARGANTTNRKLGQTQEGDDPSRRFEATYFPPWSGRHREDIASTKLDAASQALIRLAAAYKYVIHTEPLLTNNQECMLMAVQIAFQEALAATDATLTLPAFPPIHQSVATDAGSVGFHLDGQLTLVDEGVGTWSRVWISRISYNFEAGDSPKYTCTIQGSLVDTPDLIVIAADYVDAMKAAARAQHASKSRKGAPSKIKREPHGDATGGAGTRGGQGIHAPDGPPKQGAAGPLGGSSRWVEVASSLPGTRSDWKCIPGWAPTQVGGPTAPCELTVNGFGITTTANKHQVEVTNRHSHLGYHGDKYCWQWLRGGKVGSGYKIRVHFFQNTPRSGMRVLSIVTNLVNRLDGLAFWFGLEQPAAGWTARGGLLGTVQSDCGDTVFQNFKDLTDQSQRIREWAPANVREGHHFWAEVWRDGGNIKAGLWADDPATGGKLWWGSTFNVAGDTKYDGNKPGYFGVTLNELDGQNGLLGVQLFKRV